MEKVKIKTFTVDGDSVNVKFVYDEKYGVWIGEYPYFEEEPRVTPSGRPWKNVTETDCPYSDPVFKDCGTCPYLTKQKKSDLIGVCFHEKMQICPIGADVNSKEEF